MKIQFSFLRLSPQFFLRQIFGPPLAAVPFALSTSSSRNWNDFVAGKEKEGLMGTPSLPLAFFVLS